MSPRGTHQAGEGKLPDEQFRGPLVPPDLLQGQRARAVPSLAAPFPTCQGHARAGFRFRDSRFRFQVSGSRFSGLRFQVPGFQVSGFRFQVFRSQVSGPWSTKWKCGDWSGGKEVVTKSADGQNTHT